VSIIIDEETRVCVQGITGTGGSVHTRSMLDYGTRVVSGVAPGHGGEVIHGVPVFETCFDAVAATGATLSVCFVGGRWVLDAVLEAVSAGIGTVVCMEEFVPLLDASRMRRFCDIAGTVLIGPNCNGLVSPGKAKVGFFPQELGRAGSIGVISRSGTLSYGAMMAIEAEGGGESTVVGIGGAAISGLDFVSCLDLFAADDDTEVVVMVGEIGGVREEEGAAHVAAGYPKPVLALIAGRSAPAGVPMGHAGAIATAERGGWENKTRMLSNAGIEVARNLEELGRRAVQSIPSSRVGR
jgi:succinyl-CoA synthetase alpha subunit